MRNTSFFSRSLLILLLICIFVQGSAAWSVENFVISPKSGPVASNTSVSVSYVVTFSSFMSGTTFEPENTLDMYTELADPLWEVTLTNNDEDTENVVLLSETKKGVRYRLDGWTLGYSRSQLDLSVNLKGRAPVVSSQQDKIMVRIQEINAEARTLSGGKTVKYQVTAPLVTTVAAPATTPEMTKPVPSPSTPAPVTSPTIKQTYSPGPGPLSVIALLAALGAISVIAGKKEIQ